MTEDPGNPKYTTIFGEPLQIEYNPELDTLTMGAGKPANNACYVAEGLVVFND